MSRSLKRQKRNTYGPIMPQLEFLETQEIKRFLDSHYLKNKAVIDIVKKIKDFLIDNRVSRKNYDRISNTVTKIKILKKSYEQNVVDLIYELMPVYNDKDSKIEDEWNIDDLNKKIISWFYNDFIPRELAKFLQKNGFKKQDYEKYINTKQICVLNNELDEAGIFEKIFIKPSKVFRKHCIENTLNFFKEEDEDEEEEEEEEEYEEEDEEEDEEEVNYMELPFGSNKKRSRV